MLSKTRSSILRSVVYKTRIVAGRGIGYQYGLEVSWIDSMDEG
jgi:hypothetical protein